MKFILAALTFAATVLAAGKPTGGPASGTLSVYSNPSGAFKCASTSSTIPADGSAGSPTSVSIVEEGCTLIDITPSTPMTFTMSVAPKAGLAGCWIQLYSQQGCGFTLQNSFWGQPIPGVSAGSKLGCAQVPAGMNFGAASLFCA